VWFLLAKRGVVGERIGPARQQLDRDMLGTVKLLA